MQNVLQFNILKERQEAEYCGFKMSFFGHDIGRRNVSGLNVCSEAKFARNVLVISIEESRD
jgi:hypothetical protein